MSDKDKGSIQQASDIVNSALYAKGYFHDSDSSNALDRLKFSTIDDLTDTKKVYSNDKLVINTIYQLLQELDKSKLERELLQKQLNKKDEIIKSLQSQIENIESKNTNLINQFKSISNEHEVLSEKFNNLSKENINLEKLVTFEKRLSRSIKKKFEIDQNKKNKTIEQLQDRLISNNNRIKNSKDNSNLVEENTLIILQNKVESLSVEQDKAIVFLNFLLNYLNLLNDNKENLPSTPDFFFEQFENQVLSMNPDEKFLIPLDRIQSLIFASLDILYDRTTSLEFTLSSSSNNEIPTKSSKVRTLESEIETLKKNLSSALETNEKWSKKFQSLHNNNV